MRSVVLSAADRAIDALIGVLQGRGYCVIGPRRRDGAIVLEEIHSSADLPAGWTDRQTKATYRLEHTGGPAFFDHAVGPQSARRHLSPPRRSLWSATATATDAGFDVAVHVGEQQPRAFIGLRACDLAAISVQDRVLRDGLYGDTAYTAARGSGFFVGVNCGRAVETCFCASMGTGPRVTTGHDLSITEVVDGEVHELIVEVGSERGADVLAEVMRTVPSRDADAADDERVAAMTRAAAAEQVRAVQPRQARRVLTDLEHPRWDDVAERCLSCTNCTLVCPTCFCSAVEDVNSLDGRQTERIQRWDSCFTLGHSELHGAGSVRGDTRARYRQWLTHKLSTWWDQFGESGCVGCGRCITWCPAGIDITEEVAAIGEGAIS